MLDQFRFLAQITVILVLARALGALFGKIGQPRVVGEMVAGILLGPSFLGWVVPEFSHQLFPLSSLVYLNALSQVGVLVYLFLVGLSIDVHELRRHGRIAILISHVSIVCPFCLGALLAIYLYPRLGENGVSFTAFALFMGAAMSVTAFPVLARILDERGILCTKLGALSIACAAVDDVRGWCMLASILVVARARTSFASVWVQIGGGVVYVLAMLFAVRPLLTRLEGAFAKGRRTGENALALILLLMLSSALFTELFRLHALFGAFLMGAVMPKGSEFASHVIQKLESVTLVLLLPLFFALSGLQTKIGLAWGHGALRYTAVVIAVAVVGKLGGSMVAALLAGMPWRVAASLGILMNTRGLMELVILNIGLEEHIISNSIFSMMVVMAVTTTLMTTPLLKWSYSRCVNPNIRETEVLGDVPVSRGII